MGDSRSWDDPDCNAAFCDDPCVRYDDGSYEPFCGPGCAFAAGKAEGTREEREACARLAVQRADKKMKSEAASRSENDAYDYEIRWERRVRDGREDYSWDSDDWLSSPEVDLSDVGYEHWALGVEVGYGQSHAGGWGVRLALFAGGSRVFPGGLTEEEAKRRAETLVRAVRALWPELLNQWRSNADR